jgi:hypothetical protein
MADLEVKQAEMRERNGVVEEKAIVLTDDPCPQVHLMARNANEMALANSSIRMWLQQKIAQCDGETDELAVAAETAQRNKWQSKTLIAHCNLAKRRGDFYRKALAAVNAGFTIVPNFPVDLFAVRVKRDTPPRNLASNSTYKWSGKRPAHDPSPETLPLGEGRYVSGSQVIGRSGDYKDKNSKGEEITRYFFNPTDFADVQFPIECARPEVMSASAAAMALRVFDGIGICPQTRRGDPLIIGQVLGPKVGYSQKILSFLIAWHLDLRTL